MNRKLGYALSMSLKPIWIHQLKAKSPLSFRLSSCWSFPHRMVVAWIGVCLCFSFKEGIWWVFLQLWTKTLCLVRSLNLKSNRNRTTKGGAHSSLGFQQWNSDCMRSSRTCTLLFNTVAVSLNLTR
nr:uncharacterized protein LOC127345132 [Lolium perenne]